MLTFVGLIIGIGGILLGNIVEGGHVASLFQPGAAFIVLGGTLGATLVASRAKDLKEAMKLIVGAFFHRDEGNMDELAIQITDFAKIARKESILALEQRVTASKYVFFQEVMRLVIDGVDPATIRKVFETKIQ